MRTRLYIYFLILLCLATYFTTLFNGFLGDDYLQIVNNTSIQSLSNIPSFFMGSTFTSGGGEGTKGLYYRPVMQTFFAVIYSMVGAKPFYFHLFQVLLHTTNGMLLFLFLKRFYKPLSSFFIAAIFLIHPIQSEAVNYIANLQEPLFFFFGILALLILPNPDDKKVKQSKIIRKSYFLNHKSLIMNLESILILLSLLSKETGILFIFLSITYCFLYAKQYLKSVISYSLFVIGIYSFLRFFVANLSHAQTGIAQIANASFIERLLHIPAILFYYLSTFFLPLNPTSNQYWFIKTLTLTNFYLPFIILLLTTVFSYKLVKLTPFTLDAKRPDGRKPSRIPNENYHRGLTLFSAWFLLGLSLHLQLIPLDATVADRWFYFPIIGLLCILTVILNLIQDLIPKSIHKSYIVNLACRQAGHKSIFFIILITLLSLKTSFRNTNWKDGYTLYTHDIHTTPKNFILDNGYGTELIIKGEYQKAKPYIISSISDKPYYANLNNMAIISASEKNIPEAKKYLEKAVGVSTNNVVYENYANFLLTYGYTKEAVTFTNLALKQFPNNGKIWLIRAKALYLLKNKKDALIAIQRAIQLGNKEAPTIYKLITQNLPLTFLSPNK